MSAYRGAKTAPKKLNDVCSLLGPEDHLLTSAGPRPTSEVTDGKVVILYFAAAWCRACQAFDPKLRSAYSSLVAAGKNVAPIVFVSSDKDAASFESYWGGMREMGWVALPFDETTPYHTGIFGTVEVWPTLT